MLWRLNKQLLKTALITCDVTNSEKLSGSANKFSETTVCIIRFKPFQICPSIPPFLFAVLSIPSLKVLSIFCVCFTQFGNTSSYRVAVDTAGPSLRYDHRGRVKAGLR